MSNYIFYLTAKLSWIISIFSKGGNAGFPIVNVKFVLLDGETHCVDSTATAF